MLIRAQFAFMAAALVMGLSPQLQTPVTPSRMAPALGSIAVPMEGTLQEEAASAVRKLQKAAAVATESIRVLTSDAHTPEMHNITGSLFEDDVDGLNRTLPHEILHTVASSAPPPMVDGRIADLLPPFQLIPSADPSCHSLDSRVEGAFSWVGAFSSLFLYLAPLTVIFLVIERGYIESFSAAPYLVAASNAAMWTVYSLPAITACNTSVFVVNAVGVFLEVVYIGVFLRYAGPRRKKISAQLAIMAILTAVMIICGTTIASSIDFTPWPHRDPPISRQASVLGFFCFLTSSAMYCSPLAILGEVMRTQSVEYMPIWLTVATFVCATMWLGYGIVATDVFFMVPNAMGCALGLVQLGIYGWYVSKQVTPVMEPWKAQKHESSTSSFEPRAIQRGWIPKGSSRN